MKRADIVATCVVCVLLTALMLPSAMGQAKQAAPKLDSRVKKALDKVGYKYVITGLKNYRLDFTLPDGERSQFVFVSSQTTSYESLEVRKVWAVAYKTPETDLTSKLANRLLRLNVQSRLGAWEYSAREDGTGNRLKYVVRVNANCPPEDLKSAIIAVMHTADRMEKTLTKGKDDF